MANFKLKGVKNFMENLNQEIQDMRVWAVQGLIEAAIILQRNAEPGTPVDTGNLRSSWFVVTYKSRETGSPSFKGEDAGDMNAHHEQVVSRAEALAKQEGNFARPILVFGYSANYAVFVHENVDASFQRPSAEARWLYKALQRSQSEMLEAIRKNTEFE